MHLWHTNGPSKSVYVTQFSNSCRAVDKAAAVPVSENNLDWSKREYYLIFSCFLWPLASYLAPEFLLPSQINRINLFKFVVKSIKRMDEGIA